MPITARNAGAAFAPADSAGIRSVDASAPLGGRMPSESLFRPIPLATKVAIRMFCEAYLCAGQVAERHVEASRDWYLG